MNRYLAILDGLFILLYMGIMLLLRDMGRLPDTISVLDLVLIGLATARLTDIISTDEAMKWLREPFVRMERTEIADREVEVRVGRGDGWRRVIGEMLSCPWCVCVWVAAGLSYVYFLFPSMTWLFILVMAVAQVGSLLQSLGTIIVRLEKYMEGLGVPHEGI